MVSGGQRWLKAQLRVILGRGSPAEGNQIHLRLTSHPYRAPPGLIGKYNKGNAEIRWLWMPCSCRGAAAFGKYPSAACQCAIIPKRYYTVPTTGCRHISHLLNLNSITTHNSRVSYPADMPSNILRAKQYEATGHISQIYWCVTSAWRVISGW